MQLDERYKVNTGRSGQLHTVADPDRIQAMIDAIEHDPACEALVGHHLVTLRQLDPAHLLQVFRCAAVLESRAAEKWTPLTGCILASTFIDDRKARAQQSFDNAFLRLGGSIMHFGDEMEALEDVPGALAELANECNNYADVAAVRTQHTDSLNAILDDFRIPVINAGNGGDEHPSHAIADLYTLFKWRPDLLQADAGTGAGLNIAILSTPAQSRNVASFLLALTLFPHAVARIVVFGRAGRVFRPGQREQLEAAGLTIETDLDLYPDRSLIGGVQHALPAMDVIYADRTRRWQMSRQDMLHAMAEIKPGAMVLHPQLRDETISEHMDHSEHNGYFPQERHAVFIRMALILSVLGIEV